MNYFEIYKNLKEEFALKRIKAEAISNSKLFEIKKNPNFNKLSALEKEIIFMLGSEKSNNCQDKTKISKLEEYLRLTRSEKNKLIFMLGFKPEELVPNYECKKCNDSGFVSGKMCECFLKRRKEELINLCGLNKSELVRFENFNENIFSNEKQRQKSIELKTILEKWCDNFPLITKNKITLIGETGVGKTFFAKCMASRLLDRNYSICFMTAFEMNSIMLKYHTNFDSDKELILLPLLESEILFIDDLGIEQIYNNVTINYILLVLSERERLNRPIIITSNLSPENFLNRYGERIFSRLSDKNNSLMIKVEGNDLRPRI